MAPWLVVWDDHEVDNNWADDIPENTDAGQLNDNTERFRQRRTAAFQAYYENMPLRASSLPAGFDMKIYRRLQWGQLANGSDMTRTYKPLPTAYLRTAEFLDLKPGAVMLVAAHNNDLHAARKAGLATAFIPRPTEYGPGQVADLTPENDWDLTASSIIELAHRLGG